MAGKKVIEAKYDVVVVGGGMSGVCAAIASARHGASTALIQNRPVLGGNASSEIRMHICGADCSGRRPHARETGIVEEICLEHKKRNPYHSFSIFDTILWEKAHFQEGLSLYLNTHFTEVAVEDGVIRSIKAEQMTTEKIFEIHGGIFIDATGDGTLGYLAGAEYMEGREGKKVFGERYAPDESDHYTMGNTLMFKAVDTGSPVPFEKPSWAYTYTEEDLRFRDHREITSGYWWIEWGGDELNTIGDSEKIRDELMKAIYGIWDHIKNGGDHGAENYDLDWVQFLPGKRENRRLVGDYVLKEQDLLDGKVFEDAIAYGGWPMDMHVPEGLKNTGCAPTNFLHLKDIYTIPYRSIYSKNVANLMLAGRAISVSHMAFGSTRDMGTTSVVGQAAGTAAAMAIHKKILPRDILQHIKELQQTLIKDDCYIPGVVNEDERDLAKSAIISCSSESEGGYCRNITNGFTRNTKKNSGVKAGEGKAAEHGWEGYAAGAEYEINAWISGEMSPKGEWICLDFKKAIQPEEVLVYFDTNLSKVINITLSKSNIQKQVRGLPPELVKDYNIEFYSNGRCIHTEEIRGNCMRNRRHRVKKDMECDRIRIHVLSTYGDKHARIFEVRVY